MLLFIELWQKIFAETKSVDEFTGYRDAVIVSLKGLLHCRSLEVKNIGLEYMEEIYQAHGNTGCSCELGLYYALRFDIYEAMPDLNAKGKRELLLYTPQLWVTQEWEYGNRSNETEFFVQLPLACVRRGRMLAVAEAELKEELKNILHHIRWRVTSGDDLPFDRLCRIVKVQTAVFVSLLDGGYTDSLQKVFFDDFIRYISYREIKREYALCVLTCLVYIYYLAHIEDEAVLKKYPEIKELANNLLKQNKEDIVLFFGQCIRKRIISAELMQAVAAIFCCYEKWPEEGARIVRTDYTVSEFIILQLTVAALDKHSLAEILEPLLSGKILMYYEYFVMEARREKTVANLAYMMFGYKNSDTLPEQEAAKVNVKFELLHGIISEIYARKALLEVKEQAEQFDEKLVERQVAEAIKEDLEQCLYEAGLGLKTEVQKYQVTKSERINLLLLWMPIAFIKTGEILSAYGNVIEKVISKGIAGTLKDRDVLDNAADISNMKDLLAFLESMEGENVILGRISLDTLVMAISCI